MTRIWPSGDPVRATVGPDGLPQEFWWRGASHEVADIANRWRVQASWWSPGEDAWREYVKLTTVDGLLCTLYRDLRTGEWYCARLYD